MNQYTVFVHLEERGAPLYQELVIPYLLTFDGRHVHLKKKDKNKFMSTLLLSLSI